MAKVQISLRLALVVAFFLCLGGVGSVENSTPTATTAAKIKTKTTTTATTTVQTVTKNVQRNANTLTSTTKPEPNVVENNGTRITRQLQYLYSPYLFPSSTNPAQANYNVNYPVGGSAPQQFSAPGQAPHSPYYAFWSNLQTIPAHPQPAQQVRKTVNGQPVAVTSQSQSQQQQLFQLVPQFHLIAPYNLAGGQNGTGSGSGSGSVQPQSAATNIRTVALPYSQVEHGNMWNFDDSMRPINPAVAVAPQSHVADQSGSQSPKRNVSPVNFYFPFANAQFGVALDQMFEKEQAAAASGYASPSGSAGLKTGSAGSSSGFQRGHIESRPGVGSPLYHSAHNVGAQGGAAKYSNTVKNTGIGGFNRAHVEAPPSTNNNNNNRNHHHNSNYYNSLSNGHHGSHQEVRGQKEEEPTQVSFNRGAVEGAPEGFRTQSPHRGKNIDDEDSNSYGTDDAFIIQTGEKSEFQNQNGDFRKNYHNVRQGDKKVVCYFANWAWYRKGKVSFLPEHIDPMLCTHVIYAFSTFDKAKTAIAPSDVWTDVTNNFYRRTVALKEKNPNLKVLLSIGGWADSGDDKYSKLAHSPSARVKFAEEAVQFLGMYGFDGLAVDWHYPKCWQSNCDAGPGTDSTAFGDLLRVLKQYFAPHGLLLSATLSGYKEVIDLAYHVPTLNELLDLMNVMVYDYHGAWEQTTGHVAPLFYGPAGYDHYPFYNANFTMEYYVSLGADRSKLIMGIPMYGQTFTLAERINTQVGAEAIGPGDAGEYTQQPGMLAYYEICKRVREKGWTVVNDRTASWGPIAYSGNQWVGYDDATFVARKARYIQSKGFGGAFVWTMDLDDFNNDCCAGPQPLLRTIASELLNIPYKHRQGDCTAPPPPMAPPMVVTTTFPSNRPSTPSSSSHEHEHTTSSVWWRPTTTTTDKPIIWWTSSPATVPTTTTGQPSTVTWWPTKPTSTTTTTTPSTTTTYFTTTTTATTKRPSTTQRPMSEYPTRPTTTEPPRTTIVLTCHHQVNPVMEQYNMTSMVPESSPVPPQTFLPGDLVAGAPCQSSTFAFQPAKNDCDTYFQCVYDKITVRKCSAGLHYNAMAQTCDWPDNAQCQRESPSSIGQVTTMTSTTMYPRPTTTVTMPPWTNTRPTTTTMTPTTTRAPSGDCRDGDYLPGEDCSSYYLCTNGRKTLQRCGPGLHWDRTRKLCDWPSEAHCETKVHKLDVGLGDLTIRQQPCAEGSFQPSKTDCSMYYVCVHGENVPFHCQGGLYWNQNSKNCDWPSNSACDLSGGSAGGPDQGGLGVGPDSGSSGGDNGSGMISTTSRPTQWPTMPTTKRPTQWPTMTTTNRPPMQQQPAVQGQQDPIKGDFMLVCYFTNWAWYRTGEGSYRPNNINENLCTHVVYGFAVLDRTKLTIRVYDGWADLDNKFYEQVVALKKKGIKVSIAIGGWNDSEGDHYSRLVSSPAARTRFTQNVIEFIQRYDFDGLDLDWEYPKCWQVNCDKGPDSDKANFALLVKELKDAFRPYGYLLSAAVSPSKTVIDQGYDVPALSTYLDWIAVMTYDYHGQWDKKTGHVAPLYLHEEADVSYFNTNYTINYWINQGADRKKIVMGMPLYGQSFTLIDPNNNGLNAPVSGGGNQGRYTKQSGFLAYYEICQHVQRDGWTVVQDGSGAMGPYAYRGNQWVSFDDVPMIAKKSQLIRDLDIGGGMVWALDLDDFRNVCGQGEYPLLTTIKNVLSMPRMPMPDRTVPVSSPSTAINNFAPGHPHKHQQQQHQQNNQNVLNQGQSQAQIQGQNQNQNQPQIQPKPQPPKRLPGIDNQPYLENDVCEDEPYKPHEKDCNKYYQCIFGRYMEQRCPPGTFWNMDRCDWKCGLTANEKPPQGGTVGGGGGGATSKPTMTTPTTMATMTTSRPGSGPVSTMSTSSRPFHTTTRPTTMTPRPTTMTTSSWDRPSTSSPGAPVKPFECPGYGPKPPSNLQPWEKPWEPATATETNTASPVNVPDSEYKMVCYFTNWAWYRPGIGKYKPSDIDFNLCTHIAYGFAVLDGTSLTIKPHDGWADLENKFYRQVVQLKARGLKVVLAIGGWNDSLGDKYSRLVNNPDARRRFIEHMVEFLEKHCFDGLDLDWEYPKCWQVDCSKGPDSDKQGFSDLVRELSAAFKPRGLLLSSAVSPSKTVMDQGYDIPTISKYMDWISVMTYDYHGQWDKKTGHVAPMYLHEDADNVFFNTNYTINYWISQGADRKKIIMGMPMYGQSFTLVDTKDYGLNAKTSGGGTAGEFTRQSGFLAYYEICRNILSRDWTVVQDESGAIGPYAYKGNQWASFDDMNMIRRKSEYIKEMGLGGGMIWALDLDDFRNTCGCGRHPLLKTINRVLRNYQDPSMDQLTSCRLS